jgi:hypothetical protein
LVFLCVCGGGGGLPKVCSGKHEEPLLSRVEVVCSWPPLPTAPGTKAGPGSRAPCLSIRDKGWASAGETSQSLLPPPPGRHQPLVRLVCLSGRAAGRVARGHGAPPQVPGSRRGGLRWAGRGSLSVFLPTKAGPHALLRDIPLRAPFEVSSAMGVARHSVHGQKPEWRPCAVACCSALCPVCLSAWLPGCRQCGTPPCFLRVPGLHRKPQQHQEPACHLSGVAVTVRMRRAPER